MDIFRLTKTYKTARRLQQVVNVFLKHGFGSIIDRIQLGRHIPLLRRLKSFGKWPSMREPSVPERLRRAFAELGPSFIKLAQVLSSRPDLITPRYADEFKKLQDKVPPFPAEEARRIVEEELGMPLDRAFLHFGDETLAAASIAQVHPATLLDGTDVVVKVQRPDIREQLDVDIEILLTMARLIEANIPEAKFFNPMGIVQEFQKNVKREMDFVQEGRSACRFRRNFEGNVNVYIPVVYPEFNTERVLVMERIHGVRVDDIAGIERLGHDRKELARIGVDAYFKMILEDGFFHADPHPGNIFVMPSGQMGFMDFGIVGRVTEEMKTTLASTFVAFIYKDWDKLIDRYIELGLVPEDVDLEDFRKEFKADLVDLLEPLYGLTLRELDFAQYLETVVHLAMRHNLRIPSDLLLIDKAILVLEDLGTRLDPDFDFMSASEPYVTKLMRERFRPGKVVREAANEVQEATEFFVFLPKQMKKIIRKVLRNDIHMKLTHMGLEHFIRDMDRSSNRVSFAMIVSSILISSAIMHATGVGPTIYGMSVLGFITFGFAAILGVWLLVSIIRSGRL
ncbi:MAG: AarF/ABC1/UbiB kinase family protein [Nitrospirota bacterium]